MGVILPVEGVSVSLVVNWDEVHHDDVLAAGIEAVESHLESREHSSVAKEKNLHMKVLGASVVSVLL